MHAIKEILLSPTYKKRPYLIGVEIERIGMWKDGVAMHYSDLKLGDKKRLGAETLLNKIARQQNWPKVLSMGTHPIGLHSIHGKVSLEPGSQLELSSEPHNDLATLLSHVQSFEKIVDEFTRPEGIYWLGLGHNPCNSVSDLDLIPAPRYKLMTHYLGKRGQLATRMMRLTTSIQVNLDFGSEVEGIEMLRVALLLAPLSYAIFANSPFADGKITPYLSYRAEIWRKTDPDRTGLLEEVFKDNFSFEDYAKIVYTRPLMFAEDSSGNYIATGGLSLSDIDSGKLADAKVDDHNRMNAIREIFTEARLKPGYIEIRSVDGQRPDYRAAALAFWKGVLYSKEARELALKTFLPLGQIERSNLLEEVLKSGLKLVFGRLKIGPLADEFLMLARQQLKTNNTGEEKYLEPLEENVKKRLNPAAILINNFEGSWHKNMARVIEYCGEVLND